MNKNILGLAVLPIMLLLVHATPHVTVHTSPHVTTRTTTHVSPKTTVRSGTSKSNVRSTGGKNTNNGNGRKSVTTRSSHQNVSHQSESHFFRNLMIWNLITHHSNNNEEVIRVKDGAGKIHKVELSRRQMNSINNKDKLVYSNGHVYEGKKRID